jgi:hypothetical protein
MDQQNINFTEFRKQFNIPSDHFRIILKEIGYTVERVGTEQYIIGTNNFNVSDEYYLKHAVMEYRANMVCDRTRVGDFFEYEIETPTGIGRVGISTFSDAAVRPVSAGIKKKPNETPKSVLVPVNKGAELMMRRTAAPPAPPAPEGDMSALQILVSALQGVQAPQQQADPLQAHRDLLEAAESKFLLTSEVLGELLGWSKSTITSKKSGFKKLGFQFEKLKEGSSTLWRVSQY